MKLDNLNNCYTGDMEGYFLFENFYHPCYSTCKYCFGFGDEYKHKCSECIENYDFIDEYGLENNCYEKRLYFVIHQI